MDHRGSRQSPTLHGLRPAAREFPASRGQAPAAPEGTIATPVLKRAVRLAVVLWAACTFVGVVPTLAQGERIVRATGMAAGTDPTAAEEALLDAQRKAVLEAAGAFVDAETIIQDYQMVNDQILTKVRGYILDLKKGRTWVENEVTHCEIVATVGVDRLERDWKSALPHMIRRQSEPRCVLIITEDDDKTDVIPPKRDGAMTNRLEKLFLDSSFRLIDKPTIDRIMDQETEAAALKGDVNLLVRRVQAIEAELLVYGQAEANPLGPQELAGRSIYRWEMSLNARVVRLDTGEIVASDSLPDPPFVAPTMTRSCGSKEFRDLADKAGPALLKELTRRWQQRSPHEVFSVRFEGCAPDTFRKVMHPAVSRLPGVRADGGVVIRGTDNPTKEVDTEVYWAGTLHGLAKAIGSLKVGEIQFAEEGSSGAKIRFRVLGCE
jgi:hypothetical protein